MTNANDVRRAHEILDDISIGNQPNEGNLNHLRSFLPDLPKQKTLEELRREVYDVWVGTNGNEWPDDVHGGLETWLAELHAQLQGLNPEPAKPAHPEFLETEADYTNAPVGTVVARDNGLPWVKEKSNYWTRPDAAKSDYGMSLGSRRVLRLVWGK